MRPLEVLVVNPPNRIWNVHAHSFETTDKELLMPPIDILTHAALIRAQGHRVGFYDMDARDEGGFHLAGRLAKDKPDVVYMLFDEVVQLHSHTAIVQALEFLKMSREGGAKGVIAGIIPSFFYEEVLRRGAADVVVRAPAAPVLTEMFKNGELRVAGTAFVEGSAVRQLPWSYKGFHLKDYWVMPAFDLVEQEAYPIDVRALASSRGCKPEGLGCKFCPYSNFWKSYQSYAVEDSLTEVVELVERYGAQKVMFIEHNFTLDKERVLALAGGLKGLGVRFGGLSRIDVDHETLDGLADAGLRWIHFGAESGDDATLGKLRKNITTAQTRDTVRYAQRLGLRVRTSWIVDAGDTTASVDRTIDLIDELRTDEIKPHFLSYRAYSEFGEGRQARFDGQSIFCPSSEGDRPKFLQGYAQAKFNTLCDKLEADGYAVTREEKARDGFWRETTRTGSKFVALGPGKYGVGWR